MKKEMLWTLAVIVAVLVLAYFILAKEHPKTPDEIAKCIGEKSILYVQLGCHACAKQEEIFGENYKFLNVVDCFYEKETCIDKISEGGMIQTPTWIINNEKFIGVQSIEKLQNLTKC